MSYSADNVVAYVKEARALRKELDTKDIVAPAKGTGKLSPVVRKSIARVASDFVLLVTGFSVSNREATQKAFFKKVLSYWMGIRGTAKDV